MQDVGPRLRSILTPDAIEDTSACEGNAVCMQRLDSKEDIVFKLFFIKKPKLLLHMLQAVLERSIEDLTILNPEIPKNFATDKAIILDIRVQLADGARVDLEMQMRTTPALIERLVYYVARDYADQLVRGDDYQQLTPTMGIVWLADTLFMKHPKFHALYELTERETQERLTDHLSLHVLQLAHSPPKAKNTYQAHLARWRRFFIARTDHEFAILAQEDSIMAIAKEHLEALSQDPQVQRLARDRADAAKFYRIELAKSHQLGHQEGEAKGRAEGEAKGRAEGEAKGRAEGEAKGRAEGEAKGRAEGKAAGKTEGRAELLLKQLKLRFGPLSDEVEARVTTGNAEQLDLWAERILTASSLEDVFVS